MDRAPHPWLNTLHYLLRLMSMSEICLLLFSQDAIEPVGLWRIVRATPFRKLVKSDSRGYWLCDSSSTYRGGWRTEQHDEKQQ